VGEVYGNIVCLSNLPTVLTKPTKYAILWCPPYTADRGGHGRGARPLDRSGRGRKVPLPARHRRALPRRSGGSAPRAQGCPQGRWQCRRGGHDERVRSSFGRAPPRGHPRRGRSAPRRRRYPGHLALTLRRVRDHAHRRSGQELPIRPRRVRRGGLRRRRGRRSQRPVHPCPAGGGDQLGPHLLSKKPRPSETLQVNDGRGFDISKRFFIFKLSSQSPFLHQLLLCHRLEKYEFQHQFQQYKEFYIHAQ